MTLNQDQDDILQEVIDYYASRIGTHSAGCWRWHTDCLAVLLRKYDDE